jgi:hypothetical protein
MALIGGIAMALPPTGELNAEPKAAPPDAEVWVASAGEKSFGEEQYWVDARGARRSHQVYSIRGQSFDLDQTIRLASDGTMLGFEIHGQINGQSVDETYSVSGSQYNFDSHHDSGSGPVMPGLFYLPRTQTIDGTVALAEALLKTSSHRVQLAPSGTATLSELTTQVVSVGGETKNLTAYLIGGLGYASTTVWFEGNHFFGMHDSGNGLTDGLAYVPKGWESSVAQLSKARTDGFARLAAKTVQSVAPRVTVPVAFVNVRMFDADTLSFLDQMTVVADRGRIVAMGPSASVAVPPDARVLNGAGKTLIPGLWDSHFHYSNEELGYLALAIGITTVRDLGNVPELLEARRARIQDGSLLGPDIVSLLLIDGPGARSAQNGVVAGDLDSGLRWVRYAKQHGYIGIKLYGSLDRKLVAPLAAEAHRLGLRVQGHLPAGMRPLDAINAGYNEITHLNFAIMQAMPQSVVDQSNGVQRFYGPERYAGDVDLARPPMTTLLDVMQAKGIASDPTIAGFEGLWGCVPGKVAAAQAPWAGRLPPAMIRAATYASCAPSPGITSAQSAASLAKFLELIGDMHRRGIPIVAGTDAAPWDLVRDLELFHQAGFTPAEAIAAATIVPARLSGLAQQTGSIAVGKRADLVLVEGDPEKTLGDLRDVVWVMRDGRLMSSNEVGALVGLSESHPTLSPTRSSAPPTSGAVTSPGYDKLVTLFDEWRKFQAAPAIKEGLPQFTPQAEAQQRAGLATFQQRLAAISTEGWTVPDQIDHRIVQAEMNGLDFELRVLRGWAKDPGFYKIVTAGHEAVGYPGVIETAPYLVSPSKAQLEQLRARLARVPDIYAQAKANLVEGTPDRWTTGIDQIRKQQHQLAEFRDAMVARYPTLKPPFATASRAIDDFAQWAAAKLPTLPRRPSGIGIDNYNWYMRNVQLIDFDWHDQLTLAVQQLDDSWSHLAAVENRNRDLPELASVPDEAAHRDLYARIVREYTDFLEKERIRVVPEGEVEHSLSVMRPFETPMQFRGLQSLLDRKAMRVIQMHEESHNADFVFARDNPPRSPIRKAPPLYYMGSERQEGYAEELERISVDAGYMDGRGREMQYEYATMAASTVGTIRNLMVAGNRWTLEQGLSFLQHKVPYIADTKDAAVFNSASRTFSLPVVGSGYLTGQLTFRRIIAEQRRQLGDKFDLKATTDAVLAAGTIPMSLIRWEITGIAPGESPFKVPENPLIGGWLAQSYYLKDGTEYPLLGQILFTRSNWTVLYIVVVDGKPQRGSGEGGEYTADENAVTFVHHYIASTPAPSVPGLKAQPQRTWQWEPAVTEASSFEIKGDQLTLFMPSGNRLTWVRSSK